MSLETLAVVGGTLFIIVFVLSVVVFLGVFYQFVKFWKTLTDEIGEM